MSFFKTLSIFNLKWFFFILVFSNVVFLSAQCAGNDVTITICDKFSDVDNQQYDLFSVPGFNGTPGGIWSTTNPANFFALNRVTGELDLWRVNSAGTHEFTYTNASCGQSAVITIDLGGYAGIDNIDGSANACSSNAFVDMNGFIGDDLDGKVPDVNGLWEEDPSTATGFLNGDTFDASEAGPGEYIFTYTVGQVGSCLETSVTVKLEVHPRAQSGTGSDLTLCNYEDLSGYTHFNLNSLLVDEDIQGTWSEASTNQLSDLSDNIVDIQDIYNTHGVGNYSFTYSVFPSPYHPVCEEQHTTVRVVILPTLEGTMEAENYCVSQDDYIVELAYNQILLPDGVYNISYGYAGTSAEPAPASATFSNGTASFILDKNNTPTNQNLTLSISSIRGTSPTRDVCATILVPSVSFFVSNPSASAPDTCVDTDVVVSLSNIFNSSLVLSNLTHTINYAITNPDNNNTLLSGDVNFTNGTGNLIIPGSNFTNGGDYDITFDIEDGIDLSCQLSTSVTIIPTPSEIDLDLLVDNNCNASQIDVIIDAPILGDGTYSIEYDVIEQATNNILTENSINFTGGTANYQIDASALPEGNYTVRVRSSQNDTTPCRVVFDFELTENFARMGTPAAPTADALQTFCLNNYPSGPTLEDINVSANGTILFYDTATDLNILPITTLLVDGEDYFISNTDLSNNCEGSDRVQVIVTLSNPSAPTAANITPEFCEAENATLTDLVINVSNGENVVWYDTSSGGNLLDNTTILSNGVSYFASTETTDSCHSTARLEVIPTVHTLEPASIAFTTLEICGLDNPTVEDLRALESMNSYDIFWYDEPDNGTPLDFNTPLVTEMTYYAESFNPITGCRNPQRVAVTVDLSSCNPEDYNFFIPEAFSPNGDGDNDTFHVPNIGTIFPEFTLEIVNRYGNQMFIGNISKPKWDGTATGGKIAPNGVYFYIINYNKEGFKPTQGRLYLNR